MHGIGQWSLPMQDLLILCESSVCALTNMNEKVVGNGIRSLGHLVGCLSKTSRCSVSHQDRERIKSFYHAGVSCLRQKVEAGVAEATRQETNMSWRERSYTKKHAWGACSALESFFSLMCLVGDDSVLTELVFALDGLISCIAAASNLHSKIVTGAISTLSSISEHIWLSRAAFGIRIGVGICATIDAACTGNFEEVSCVYDRHRE
jgi:hypothetical protein